MRILRRLKCRSDDCGIDDKRSIMFFQNEIDPVGNQTFFSKSKILEKVVKQVQDDMVLESSDNAILHFVQDDMVFFMPF